LVDTREFGGKASAKGVHMPKSTGSRYTQEFKAEAVQLARSSPERSIRQIAYELGISDQTLRNWIKQAQIDRGCQDPIAGEGPPSGRGGVELAEASAFGLVAASQVDGDARD
jgi:transposase-like protein